MKVEDFWDIGLICEDSLCELANDLKLPDWITSDVLVRMKEVIATYYNWRTLTRKLQRLKAGVFLNEFLIKIEKIAKNSKSGTDELDEFGKLNIYSTVSFIFD